MGLNYEVSVPVLTVLLQGVLSFFSPCVFPLIPLYIGYLSGGTMSKDEQGRETYNHKKVILHTLFFVIGISFAWTPCVGPTLTSVLLMTASTGNRIAGYTKIV